LPRNGASVIRLSRMSTEPEPTRAGASYAYRPSLLGGECTFTLTDDGIDWAAGGRSGRVPFSAIRHVRMSYRPMSMQSHRFTTEIWAEGAPKLTIISTSWKSLVEQERRDKPYAAFIAELHRRLAQAGVATRFEQGSNRILYWPGLAVFASMVIGLALLVIRALEADAKGGAAFIGVFLLLFLWQGGQFFRRNLPGIYRPEAPPAELTPNV
jgi:hypothetical protein